MYPMEHPANGQLAPQRVVVRVGKFPQPLVQSLAHLTRGFFGEGDGQNFLRAQLTRRGFEQRPHDAGHQHPGFTDPGAGLHRHTAARVTGNGVEGFGGDRLAVALVGGRLIACHRIDLTTTTSPACQPGLRNRLCRAAGAAAPLGGRELHEVNERGSII